MELWLHSEDAFCREAHLAARPIREYEWLARGPARGPAWPRVRGIGITLAASSREAGPRDRERCSRELKGGVAASSRLDRLRPCGSSGRTLAARATVPSRQAAAPRGESSTASLRHTAASSRPISCRKLAAHCHNFQGYLPALFRRTFELFIFFFQILHFPAFFFLGTTIILLFEHNNKFIY